MGNAVDVAIARDIVKFVEMAYNSEQQGTLDGYGTAVLWRAKKSSLKKALCLSMPSCLLVFLFT